MATPTTEPRAVPALSERGAAALWTPAVLFGMGLPVIPATVRKAPAVPWKVYQDRLPTQAEFDSFTVRSSPVWGIVTGEIAGRVVLDFDGIDGQRTLERLGLKPHVISPTGGAHLHVAHPGFRVGTENHNSSSRKPWSQEWPGLDIRADGGFEALIGATEKGSYSIVRDLMDLEPWEALPAAFRRHFEPRPCTSKAGIEDELLRRALELASSIGRNEAGLWLACQLRDTGCGEGAAGVVMDRFQRGVGPANRKGEREEYTQLEARASLRNAYARPAREPWRGGPKVISIPAAAARPLTIYPLSDSGNAERLIATHGEDLRFSPELRSWLHWDGRRWNKDTTGAVRLLMVKTMRRMHVEAADIQDSDLRRSLEGWARGSENGQRITAALREAQCLDGVPIQVDELDADPNVLNVLNGIVDLKTGLLLPHEPARLCSKMVQHAFRPEAPCPRFQAFLARIMGADPDAGQAELDRVDALLSYLQKVFGYALTGLTTEKAVFVFHGGGNNGKTTLLALLHWLLADYAALLQIDTLMSRTESNNTQSDLADLCGSRFVMTSETEEGQRLSEGKVKRITQGMGRIKAVRKYENPITFPETHKLFMDANHRPVVRGTDNAIWNRLHLIPFDVVIPPEEVDRNMSDRLKIEAEGILAWCIAGAVCWYSEGLGRPPEVEKASAGWRAESDPLKDFLEEQCVLSTDLVTNGTALYQRYEIWAEVNGEHRTLDRKQFKARLIALGCSDTMRTFDKGFPERAWKGVALR
jgi:putative DNA primase/helicase